MYSVILNYREIWKTDDLDRAKELIDDFYDILHDEELTKSLEFSVFDEDAFVTVYNRTIPQTWDY